MPAYFVVVAHCDKKNRITQKFEKICGALEHGGMTFKSGYWGFEDNSLEEIIEWNQTKLEENFELGYDEHHDNDYRQIRYDCGDFSETRMYVLNCKEEDFFTVSIIVPEEEVVSWTDRKRNYDPEALKTIEEVMIHLWQLPFVLAVQTELELSDGAFDPEDLERGEEPSAEPLAILPREISGHAYLEKYETFLLERDGILLKRK